MAVTKAQRRALVADIRAAFADVPVPAVVVAEDCWERDSEAVFVGRCWRDLDDVTLLRRHADMLFWFSAEAFRHYLPAFLLAAILHPREADIIPLTLVSVLTREEWDAALFEERVRGCGGASSS